MSDEINVPGNIVSAISESMEGRTVATHNRNLTEDNTVQTLADIKKGLKEGRIPGGAVVEWDDEKGSLRVNVIDFLTEDKIKATDPESYECVLVKTSEIPDGSWRLLY